MSCVSPPQAIYQRLVSDTLQSARRWQRDHWFSAGLITTALAAVISIIPGFSATSHVALASSWVNQSFTLPEPIETLRSEVAPRPKWQSVVVQPGQTMAAVFESLNLSRQLLHRLLEHPGAKQALSRIRPGDQFDFEIAGGKLRAMRFAKDESTRVVLQLGEDQSINEQVQSRPLEHRVLMTSGTIADSLYNAAEAAGMTTASILELAKVFGYDIDFAQDLRVGDQFHVVYEEIWRDGERLRSGDILAATFVNQGRKYQVFRYVFADGRSEYYDAEGRPTKKSFLRMPIEFARISSRFSSARKHPILGRTRAHRGVDYAAGSGTPIMSAGEGKIQFAGWKNGYGRTIIVQHANNITTLYGHMSKLGKYRTGQRVRQGDVIGYVGMTGLASGPHLHYEFRVAGVHRDPLKVTLPKPQPLPANEFDRFRLQTQPLLAQLKLRENHLRVASR